MTRGTQLGAVGLTAVAVAVVGLVAGGMVHVGPRTGVDRVRHLVRWPEDCASIDTEPMARLRRLWPRAREGETVTCEMAGPWVMYVRFANAADVRHDLLRDPPESPTCLAGREVVIDGLDHPGQFARVCRALGGTDVDGVSGLPEIAGGVTMNQIDRSVRKEERRDTRAQLRALRAHWHAR